VPGQEQPLGDPGQGQVGAASAKTSGLLMCDSRRVRRVTDSACRTSWSPVPPVVAGQGDQRPLGQDAAEHRGSSDLVAVGPARRATRLEVLDAIAQT
jgi:hypothetical protein